MAVILPFRSARPYREHISKVASEPYDVVRSEEARMIAQNNELSFLHVTKSEIDLPDGTNPYSDEVYQRARQNLDRFMKTGVMFQEKEPAFYVYCQRKGSHEQCGIGACVHVEEFDIGNVKKHEMTLPAKQADRTKHIDAVNAQTGPIFLAYRSREEINRLVGKIRKRNPEYDFVATDGVSHSVWVVDDKASIRQIETEFRKVERLYIADGHHRAASGVAVAKMRGAAREERGRYASYDLILAVLFPHDNLQIKDYNRVVKDLRGLSAVEFITKVQERFSVEPDYSNKYPQSPWEFGMYIEGKWFRLRWRNGCSQENDLVGALDVSILQENLLGPILGIQDPRSDARIRFVGATRGIEELERKVDSGEFKVAFALYPPTLEQMMKVADAGKMMPPKSTWFEPKLMDGILVHLIGDEESDIRESLE